MQVHEGMSTELLVIGPGHTLREAARLMAKRKVGSAIVLDPDQPSPALLSERDILAAVGAERDLDAERVGDHVRENLITAAPDWSLEQAATTMTKHNFRHLLVCEDGDVVGIVSVRDIVYCWTGDGATSSVPA